MRRTDLNTSRVPLTTVRRAVPASARKAPIQIALLVAALAFLLAACAPTSEAPRVDVDQLTEPITYYPFQTGATWQYLPDGARLNDPTTTVRVEGPTVAAGEVWVAWHTRGRGLDQMSYRATRPDGVFLMREVRLGTTFTFDPPLKEYPQGAQLRVGANWSGSTSVHLSADGGRQQRTMAIDYVYTVVDKRLVTTPAGQFDVFVIDFTSRTFDELGNITDELTQQTWFAPHVGEVRTRNGHLLVASNVLAAESSEAP